MSFLQLTGLPATKKGVIAFSFRVPQAAINTAKLAWLEFKNSGDNNPPPLCGIVPLVVFGGIPEVKNTSPSSVQVGESSPVQYYDYHFGFDPDTGDPNCDGPGWVLNTETSGGGGNPVYGSSYTFDGTTTPIDPSYIGVDCRGGVDGSAPPQFSIRLVSNVENKDAPRIPILTAYEETGSENAYNQPPNFQSLDGACIDATYCGPYFSTFIWVMNPIVTKNLIQTYSYPNDIVKNDWGKPEIFSLLPERAGYNISYGGNGWPVTPYVGQAVKPDHWHEVIFSFDLSNRINTHSIVGEDDNISDEPCDITGVITTVPAATADTTPTAGSRTSSACRMWLSFDDVNLTSHKLSAYWPNGYSDKNGILTATAYEIATTVNYNTLNVFSDSHAVSINAILDTIASTFSWSPGAGINFGPIGWPATTSFVNNVLSVELGVFQMFTGVSVDTGDPVKRHAFFTAKGKPAAEKAAAKLLKQKPAIQLYCAEDWQKAKNRGAVKNTGFTVGKIDSYKPDPSLHGPQG